MKTDYITDQHHLETEQEHTFMRDNQKFACSLNEMIRRGDFKNYRRLLEDGFVETLALYTTTDIEIGKLYEAVHVSDLIRAATEAGIPSNITENLKKEYFVKISKINDVANLQQVSAALLSQLEQEYKRYGMRHYSHTIQCAIEYIHTQRFQPLSTSDVAGYLNVEQTNLSKRFSKEVGMTVTNYIHTLKTDLARTLILRRTFSLMEISDMLGYGSYHYFCKVFRKYQHCLPSQV